MKASFPVAVEALLRGKDIRANLTKQRTVIFNRDTPLANLFSYFEGCSVEDIWLSIEWEVE